MLITSKELAQRTGATYRQIDYWCGLDLISAVGKNKPGSGYYRGFEEAIVPRVTFLVKVSNAFNHSFRKDTLKMISDSYEEGSIDLGDGITLSWK